MAKTDLPTPNHFQGFSGRAARQAVPYLVLATGLLLCACVAPARNNHGLAPERLAQLEGICVNTMKFSPGDARFNDCMDVLSETAKSLDKARSAR